MSPAEVVIDVFGGIRSAARVLKIEPSTVWRWRWETRCSGAVPSEHFRPLLDAATKLGKRLTLEELVWGRPTINRRVVSFNLDKDRTKPSAIAHMAAALTV